MLLEFIYGDRAVPLTQLRAVGTQHPGQVGELRRLVAESFVQKDVMRSGGDKLLCPYHVAYLHFVVVNHVCQIIGRITVRFEQHEVVEGIIFKFQFAPDDVIESCLSLKRSPEPDYRLYTFFFVLSPLLGRKVAAVAVIAGRLFAPHLLLAHFLETLRRAVAVIGVSLCYQLIGSLTVHLNPLRLNVGSVAAADIRSFVPIQSKPLQTVYVDFDGTLYLTGDVSILDAEYETAGVVPGEKPGEQGSPDITDVRTAGRAGGEPYSD